MQNIHCTGTSNQNGTCYTDAECAERKGVASGTCADGFGVCCICKFSLKMFFDFWKWGQNCSFSKILFLYYTLMKKIHFPFNSFPILRRDKCWKQHIYKAKYDHFAYDFSLYLQNLSDIEINLSNQIRIDGNLVRCSCWKMISRSFENELIFRSEDFDDSWLQNIREHAFLLQFFRRLCLPAQWEEIMTLQPTLKVCKTFGQIIWSE